MGYSRSRAEHTCTYHPTEVERFAMKVLCDLRTGCWTWTGSGFGTPPRGKFWLNGQDITAAHYAWEQARGAIPEGLFVLHTQDCSSAMCVRPSHLYIGTQKDNMRDRVEVGHGERDRHGRWA